MGLGLGLGLGLRLGLRLTRRAVVLPLTVHQFACGQLELRAKVAVLVRRRVTGHRGGEIVVVDIAAAVAIDRLGDPSDVLLGRLDAQPAYRGVEVVVVEEARLLDVHISEDGRDDALRAHPPAQQPRDALDHFLLARLRRLPARLRSRRLLLHQRVSRRPRCRCPSVIRATCRWSNPWAAWPASRRSLRSLAL